MFKGASGSVLEPRAWSVSCMPSKLVLVVSFNPMVAVARYISFVFINR